MPYPVPGSSTEQKITCMTLVMLAQVAHETNTFSKRAATLSMFRQRELLEGREIIEVLSSTNSELAGFIEVGLAHRWILEPVIATEATPCGRVEADAWQYFHDRLVGTILQHAPVDIILIALHGAMVSADHEDADGDLLEAIRAAAGPRTIIACTLDLHANPSDRLAAAANILLPFMTYPHVDMRERGMELAEIARQSHADSTPWQSHVFRNPQLDGCDQGRSNGKLMPQLLSMAAAASKPGSLRVGICAGFPWADVPHAGPSIVISGTTDRADAARVAAPLLLRMWETRAETSLVSHPPATACRLARDLVARGRRVLIADHTDNPGGGGYGTTTALLAALIAESDIPSVFAPICDASAAALCIAAGVGSEISLLIGTEPDEGFSGPPLMLSGRVIRCGEVSFRATGLMWLNRLMHLGPTALLRCGNVDLVITSNPLQVIDTAYLDAAGVDVERARIIVIKSLQHFRAAFEPLVDDILFADSGGLVSTQFHRFPYQRVRRPIWPLDEQTVRQ